MLQGILLFLPIGRWGGGPAEGWWRGMGRDLRISPPPPPSAAVPLPMHAWGGIGRGRGNSVPRPLPVAIESSGPARAGNAPCADGDRKSDGWGKGVSERVDLGGRVCRIKKKR